MSAAARDGGSECDAIRELMSWLPTGTLDEDERRRVEKHAAGCAACTDWLRFSGDVKDGLGALAADHPEPETLVHFVEASDATTSRAAEGSAVPLSPEARAHLEAHLALCPSCSREVAILRQVGSSDAAVPAPPADAPARSWLESWREALTGTLLRPIPAGVYLIVAIIAVASLLTGPSRSPRPLVETDQGRIGSVVLLPDESSRLRGSEAVRPIPVVPSQESRFLLLEFTDLETPPQPEDSYQVSLVQVGSAEPIRQEVVSGSTFSDNYTLYYLIEAGSLPEGHYEISVSDPDDVTIYRGKLEIR